MYKVLLADDESIVLDGLRRRVHWSRLGLEVVGTASDGLEAIRLVEQLRPDILVTDIVMPVMDGIQLIETIRQLGHPVRIIILSGHDEFSYAQKAIRLGAIEYQLKPVSCEEIEASLSRIVEQLELEQTSLREQAWLEESSQQQAQLVKKYMLADMVSGKADHFDRLVYELGKIDQQSLASQFVVSLLAIDDLPDQSSPEQQKNTDLTIFLTLNISNEIIGGNNTNFAIKIETNLIALITIYPLDWAPGQIESSIQWMFSLIQENIHKYLGHTATIGVGPVVRNIEDVRISYQRAADTLRCRVFYGPGALLYDNALARRLDPDSVRRTPLTADLHAAVRDLDRDKVCALVKQVFADIAADPTSSYDHLIQVSYKLVLEAKSLIVPAAGHDGLSDPGAGDEVALLDQLRTFARISDLTGWILEYFNLMFDLVGGGTRKSVGLISSHIIDLIESKYQTDISLNDIAGQLYMSANYLSTLFKKETGVSFKRYLNDFRLEKAKQLLLNPIYKIYQVANLVGYENEEHFSRLFKSTFGLTCKEFRDQAN